MVVYLLYSNWMHNGDNAVNEVVGVYDCLRKAQQSLCEFLYSDLNSYPFDNIEGDGQGDIKDYNIAELANMFYDDQEFKFDFTSVRLWNGENEDDSEDYQNYNIEKCSVQ
jgi:hypothetical protein